jgi:hypothetical protein
MLRRFLSYIWQFSGYLWIPILLAWELAIQPIWNLNIETWASRQGLNDEVDITAFQKVISMIPQSVWDWLAFFTGDFLWGAVTVGVIYFLRDVMTWLARRKAIKSKKPPEEMPLSFIYNDLTSLHRTLTAEVSPEYGRRPAPTEKVKASTAARTRSFFAQLRSFAIDAPTVGQEMTAQEAKMVIEFLDIATPFVGKSQVEQLRGEADIYIKKIAKAKA